MAEERLDVIIFGATGFTGKHAILEGLEILKGFSWGVAGRNESKLKEVLKEIGGKASKDVSLCLCQTPIIIADIENEDSLLKMAKQAKVIVNCCGPYRFYGEPVIKACIDAGTHHVDITGEPQFMEHIQLEYDALAREKGVYIISACGFDSIPAELGILHHQQHFDGELNSIDSYLVSWVDNVSTAGPRINYGTWASGIQILGNLRELSEIRKELFKEPLPEPDPKEPLKLIHRPENGKGWCVPFVDPFPDLAVVQRTQRYFYEKENRRPIQYHAYTKLPSILHAIAGLTFGMFFLALLQFKIGQNLLLKYPDFFSFGMFSREGPTDEVMKNTKFSFTFYGKGWPKEEQLAESTDRHTTKPTKRLVTRVTGSNPAYGATNVCLLLAATTILTEKDNLPKGGGVLTPGVCFSKTNLISSLCKHGFHFEILSGSEVDTPAN